MTTTRMFRKLGLALALASLTLAGNSAPAHAGLLVESAEDCVAQPTEAGVPPLAGPAELRPGQGRRLRVRRRRLEALRRARRRRQRAVARGGRRRQQSLSIPAGASATSPAMCAGLDHLFMRYFAKSKASLLGTLTSHLRVEVLIETSPAPGVAAARHPGAELVVGPVAAGAGGGEPPAAPPGRAHAGRVPLHGRRSASWTIDDVYLDPRFRG